jgi:peptide/nickel transport system substrate-binding protein
MKRLVILIAVCLIVSLSFISWSSVFAQKKYREAPMLAELVKQGKLPRVEERLPEKPFVVGPGVLISKRDLPDWRVGKYGGTLRNVHTVADWAPDVFCMNNEPLLIAPGIGTSGIKGNIVESFEVRDNNRVFTFRLRKGLKWSDGHPVTTEDIRFTYEDVLLNEKLNPTLPAKFRVGKDPKGEPMKLEIIDELTFRITFPKPNGGFLRILSIENWAGYTDLLKPAHYLKQFHIKYTPLEKLKPLLEKEGFREEWWKLFDLKDFTNFEQTQAKSIGFPVLTPWILVKAAGGVYEWERNPYYFKVDTAGNQLPYIDRIVSTLVQDVEMANMRALTGEVDWMREGTSLIKVPLYREYGEKAGFRIALLDNHATRAFYLNLTYKDPVWRKIVQDVRFRRAITLAINRKEIIDSIYYGFVSLPETVPSEYDIAEANKLLDQMGLDKRDQEGYRLRPDGKVLNMLIECGAQAPDLLPLSELIVEYLKNIGIKATLKRIDPQLWSQRNSANEIQATVYYCHDLGWDNSFTSRVVEVMGPLWRAWYDSDGKQGEEPPAWVKKAYEIDKKRWESVTGSEEYNRLRRDGLSWHRQYIPIITIVEKIKLPMIVSARLGNIPKSGQAIAANFSVEQIFFEK